MRSDALYYSEACEKRHKRRGMTDIAPTLDEVRGQHEESKGRWTVVVREHLNRTLLKTGFVSAEDFDALGIPDEHRNLANAQMGAYSRAGYMEPLSWRRSTKASRKSGKIWTHRLTELGRTKLAGVSTGVPTPRGLERSSSPADGASADPGEADARHDVGDPRPQGQDRATNPSVPNADVDQDETRAGVGGPRAGDDPGPVSSEPARLFELPPERSSHDRIAEAA
jgi:hypothetical protein